MMKQILDMMKRILAMLLSLMLALSVCVGGLELIDWSTVLAEEAESYTASLYFMSTDYGVSNFYTPGTTDITGAGDYSITWNMNDGINDGKTATGAYCLYVNIPDAYAAFQAAGYSIENVAVKVDGVELPVTPGNVLKYQATDEDGNGTDAYVLDLYSAYGVQYGVTAIDGANLTCSESITVSFTVVEPQAGTMSHNAKLYFANSDFTLSNYLTAPSTTVMVPGDYTLSWDMYSGYDSDSIGWLYIEIDDAFTEYTTAGYKVEDVELWIDGVQVPIDQDKVWTYASAVAGEEDDLIIELYNANGFSSLYGSAIGNENVEDFYCAYNITVKFAITDGAEDESQNIEVHTGKWIDIDRPTQYTDFNLILEGFVTGTVTDVQAPMDVVLVLDQSASMYTPVGALNYLYNYSLYTGYMDGLERYGITTGTKDPSTQSSLTGVLNLLADSSVDDTKLTNAEKLGQLGYFVAQDITGGSVMCTTEEHVHNGQECTLCGLAEHTHTTACYPKETHSERVASFYNWAAGSPWSSWYNAMQNKTGTHLRLLEMGYGYYRVADVKKNMTGAATGWTAENDQNAQYEYWGGSATQSYYNYLSVSNYNELHTINSIQVGDVLYIKGAAWADDGTGGSANNTNAYVTVVESSYNMIAREAWTSNAVRFTNYNLNFGNSSYSAPTAGNNYTNATTGDKRLTDGKTAISPGEYGWQNSDYYVMWQTSNPGQEWGVSLTVDYRQDIYADTFVVHGYCGSTGINAPSKFGAMYFNGQNYVTVGESSISYISDGYSFTMVVQTDEPIKAKIFGFLIYGEGSFICLDEIKVSLSNASNTFKLTYVNRQGSTHQCGADCAICGQIEHTHWEPCGLTCSYTENHVHTAKECVLTCTNTSNGHVHGNACYGCGNIEGHTHSMACGLVCGKVDHTHSLKLLCTNTEASHVHTDACYACGLPTCGKTAHKHYIGCFGEEFGCTETVHTHVASCFGHCQTPVHTHGEECGIGCGRDEHTHSPENDSSCWTYDWYICQYHEGDNGKVDVYIDGQGNVAFKDGCDDYFDMWRGIYTTTAHYDYNGVNNNTIMDWGDNYQKLTVQQMLQENDLYFYRTQYGALFDALNIFINDLGESGLQHRVSVVGFAAEFLTAREETVGTGIYVDGEYYPITEETLDIQWAAYVNAYKWGFMPSSYTAVTGSSAGKTYTDALGMYNAITNDAAAGNAAAQTLLDNICKQVYDKIQSMIQEADSKTSGALYEKALMVMNEFQLDEDGNIIEENGKPVTDNGAGLQNILNTISAYQADYFYTNHYLGMYQAYEVLEAYMDNDLPGDDINGDGISDRQSVVIMFTDGIAQAHATDGNNQAYKNYQEYTNDLTVEYARQIENDFGASVYAIATSTVKASDLEGVSYLFYTASNFADTVQYDLNDDGTRKTVTDADGNKKYSYTVIDEGVHTVEEGNAEYSLTDSFVDNLSCFMRVKSAETMADAFLKVMYETGGTLSALGVKASMQDILAAEFELPDPLKVLIPTKGSTATTDKTAEGYDADAAALINQYIKVYTVDAIDGTNGTVDTSDDDYNFPANTRGLDFVSTANAVTSFNDDAIIEIGLRSDGRYYVAVDGFDYASNYVSSNGRDTDNDGVKDFWGQKLVVTVPIATKSDSDGGEYIWTNYDTNTVGGNSGILAYTFETDAAGNEVITGIREGGDFEEPHVDIPTTVTVKKIVDGTDTTAEFDFTGIFQKFAAYDVYDEETGCGNEEVRTGNKWGGNYLIATGEETTKAATLGNNGTMTMTDVLVGSSLTITEEVNSLYDMTVKVYDANGKEVTDGVTVNAETGEVVIDKVVEGMTVVFTNTAKMAELTIVKDGWEELDGGQSFIFRVLGADNATAGVDMTVIVEGNGSVTIRDLPVGQYIITEESGWSWRYSVENVTSKDGTGEDVAVYITTPPILDDEPVTAQYNISLPTVNLTVTFENERDEEHWVDGNDNQQNLFTGSDEEG